MRENLQNTIQSGKIKGELFLGSSKVFKKSLFKQKWSFLLLCFLSFISLPGRGAILPAMPEVGFIMSPAPAGVAGNAPAFAKSAYTFAVSDNADLGYSVGSVTASDPEGSSVRYTLTAGNTNSTFALNSTTGSISLAKFLDYHLQDRFTLTVKATDAEGLSDVATVTVTVNSGTPSPDFSSIQWGTAASQPMATHEVHGVTVNGKLYIFGGYDVEKQPDWTPTKRSYVYDPALNKWSSIADLPHTPRGADFGGVTHEGLTTDGTDIYFAGGYTARSTGTGQVFGTKQVWKYNVASNTYTALPSLPKELAAGQMQYLKGKLHYAGGANLSRADIADHYVLDLDNLSAGWKTLAPLSNPRNHPGSAVYQGKLYYIGGAHHQNDATVAQKTVEVYDPEKNTWTRVADMPVGRDHISSSVFVMGNRIIVIGGETSHNVRSKLVSAYNPATNTWSELTPLPAITSAGIGVALKGAMFYTGGNFSKTNRKGVLPATAVSQQVSSLTLVNADNEADLQTLVNGSTLNLATLPSRSFNIRANTNPATVGSVKFTLSGTQSKTATESGKPYALFGDDVHGDYYAWTPAVGSYTLTATPYTAAKGAGTAGTTLTVSFTVVDQAPEENQPLISNVSATTGNAYTVTDVAAGKLMYTDRTYKITSVPASLAGASLIQTANNDKWNTSTSLLSFRLAQKATVYIAYDPRGTTLPGWLSGWQKLSDRLGVDDSKISSMDLYSKSFEAGEVTLGGNKASPAAGAENNYLVLALAAVTPATSSALVSNVAAVSGRSYSLAEAQAGELMYTDRTYQITSVPSFLQNAALIQPANDDKKSTSTSLLSFELSEQAVVYVAYDPRGTMLPGWLSGWQKLSDRLGVDDSQISSMDLYSKSFEAGEVTLGGNLASPARGAQTNYLVIAVPANQTLTATAQAVQAAEQPLRLRLFPNPNTGSSVYVEVESLAAHETVKITLYDVLGHALISQEIVTDKAGKAGTAMLLSSQMKKGVYFIEALAPSGKLQSKLLVQ
ncbi:cadherin domain-containing protein [Pontibacter sp. 172403-2]|uniref:Kelch repeat-containing protein n=1 Tax=Pontibacter rufus TaxID=2791028 RepID=UPI0018AFF688|nr:kelch repeat-containing protein [Pontibacter sp. 172403-2]MBF9254587.1 cadherin domain-containing protein [Pontibacter sp. 172403-2]